MIKAEEIKKELESKASRKRAKDLQRFFKTRKGEYGEGDVFIGINLPEIRQIAQKYQELEIVEIKKLLNSAVHEQRSLALIILASQFEKGDEKQKTKIFDFYLKNIKGINNWDLVDISAHKILGAYLFRHPKNKKVLRILAESDNLWERRISIIATFYFISQNEFEDALKIAKKLINDKHDLIHKAVGWMLREIGKRNSKSERAFLKQHYKQMPRTMLRYAIERFPERERKNYLKGKA